MELTLVRDTLTDVSTTGELSIDGKPFCWTLELPNKDGRPGSCIPQGLYPVVAFMSRKFNRSMPLLQNVPERSSIEMHWGNTAEDTEGCILLGGTRDKDYIGNSRQIFDDFWVHFMGGLAKGNVLLHVIGGAKAPQQEIHLDAEDM